MSVQYVPISAHQCPIVQTTAHPSITASIQQDHLFIVNPNASSCPPCAGNDTMEMAKCYKCNNWYQFKWAGVKFLAASVIWICEGCRNHSTNTKTKSIKSSTSSKRRSIMLLEELAKEKAIQDRLIEEKIKLAEQQAERQARLTEEKFKLAEQEAERQAKTDLEDLHRKYDILESALDSEDDGQISQASSARTSPNMQRNSIRSASSTIVAITIF